MLSRAIDASLGVAVAVSLKYLVSTIEDAITLSERIDVTIKDIITSRIYPLHTKFLRDPCYFEMSTDERWVIIEPYFHQLFKVTAKTIPAKRLDRTRAVVREAVTQIIFSKGV